MTGPSNKVEHGQRVVRETSVPLALVGRRDPRGEHRRASESVGGVRRIRSRQSAVPEAGAGADDPGADGAHDRVHAFGLPHATSADATETAASSPATQGPTATVLRRKPSWRSARTVSENDTGNAPPPSWR